MAILQTFLSLSAHVSFLSLKPFTKPSSSSVTNIWRWSRCHKQPDTAAKICLSMARDTFELSEIITVKVSTWHSDAKLLRHTACSYHTHTHLIHIHSPTLN